VPEWIGVIGAELLGQLVGPKDESLRNGAGGEAADFPAAAQNPSARRHLLLGEALQFWQFPACQLWHRNCEETLPRGNDDRKPKFV
jgi:hypothetical protein